MNNFKISETLLIAFGLTAIAIPAVMLFATGPVSKTFKQEEQIQQQQYCELVQLWADTNGENGHPDYKKVAKHWCKPD